MSFDRWDWHIDNLPNGLPKENAAIHIGVYFAWCINNDLISLDEDEGHEIENLQKVKNREMTGTEYFIEYADGKLWDVDFNEKGLEFTEYYYEELYYPDFGKVADKFPPYTIEDNWDIYNKVAPIIDKSFKKWLKINQRTPLK